MAADTSTKKTNRKKSPDRASTKTQKKAKLPTRRTTVTKKQAEAELHKNARRVTEKDVKKVLKKKASIEKKFLGEGPLGRFIEDGKLMIALVKDYSNGSYTKIPFWTIAAIVAALLYVLNPVDLIPDFIPFVGFVDDALVVGACLMMVEQDLHTYKSWKIKK